ncbi:MAG: squalene synthase HpnC [Proteobacteria bacterium]|nr:squalene synthase HpnC [Pseudomonadota bacterium]
MTDAAAFASGKGHRDENFPVASWLVRRELRAPILAFYRFARAADDVADHPGAAPDQKLAQLARMEAALRGDGGNAEGMALRAVLQAHSLTDQHALDLLEAFRRDVTKKRYADWAELMDYCRYSAAPVGRFVLDLHGEARTLWPANDALCTALQVINHLQDCGKDHRALDRVYIPLDALAAQGAAVDDLAATCASPALLRTIEALAGRTADLLGQSRGFAPAIADRRLALEVGAIQALAEDLTTRLTRRDPLSQRVHHRPVEAAGVSLRGAFKVAIGWLG